LDDLGDRLQLDRDVVRLYMNQAAQAIPTVMNRLQGANMEPVSLTLTQPTLDDVFLQVTGQRLVTGSPSLAETARNEPLSGTEESYR
jgi:ABC-2 type transport system ATP-binding protein